jgi:acyl dehydratase
LTWNLDAVGQEVAPVDHSWSSSDTLLYSLGVGAGAHDPFGFELEFTTDNSEGKPQLVLPTFGVTIALKNSAFALAGAFDPTQSVHGEQGIRLARPIPPEGRVTTMGRLTGIYDKGSGAVVTADTRSVDATTGELMFTTTSSLFVRGAGGFGGPRGPSAARSGSRDAEADLVLRAETRHDQALLYRLSGDRNPLHSDPAFAQRAGFATPILHGLCTYGFAGRLLLHALYGSDPTRFVSMDARFSRPARPGDPLTVQVWRDGPGEAQFRVESEPGTVVLDQGRLVYRDVDPDDGRSPARERVVP